MLRAREEDSNLAPQLWKPRQGAVADSSIGAGNGSRLYEVNIWMWRYDRGQARSATPGHCRLGRTAAEGCHL